MPEGDRIRVISSDGAYYTRGVYEASASRYAALVVPPRRNGKPCKARTSGAAARNKSLRAPRHLGRRLWTRWSGYHCPGLAETAMSRLKRPGERPSARDPTRQTAAFQICCAILNTFNALGCPTALPAFTTWRNRITHALGSFAQQRRYAGENHVL